jgi:glycosyltransferase involved in cell wall biosynthesis
MITSDLQKISCLMVTNGRFELMKQSIACYVNQSYKHKELVIVCQGDHNECIRGYVNSLNRSDIHFANAPSTLSLGALRNLSLEISTGKVVCQWDDDDYYHPGRLVCQYKTLMSSPNITGVYYAKFFKFFDIPEARQMYWVDWSSEVPDSHKYLCGSGMFHKEQFYEYHNLLYPEYGEQSGKEEDLNVLEKLMNNGVIAIAPADFHYVYAYHGVNTYGLAHHRMVINTMVSQKVLATTEEIKSRENELKMAFQSIGISVPFEMCSNTDVVFEYEPQGDL